jgi:hypothetical protein
VQFFSVKWLEKSRTPIHNHHHLPCCSPTSAAAARHTATLFLFVAATAKPSCQRPRLLPISNLKPGSKFALAIFGVAAAVRASRRVLSCSRQVAAGLKRVKTSKAPFDSKTNRNSVPEFVWLKFRASSKKRWGLPSRESCYFENSPTASFQIH